MANLKSQRKYAYTIEYSLQCSPNILFEFLSTTGGLQEWFADKVLQREKIFSFFWDDVEHKAECFECSPDQLIKFRWLDKDISKNEYFGFTIEKSEISNRTILTITDFASKNDLSDQKLLWEHQIKKLFHRIGIH